MAAAQHAETLRSFACPQPRSRHRDGRCALWDSYDPEVAVSVTTDMHLRYYRQPGSGPFSAEATVVHKGRRLLSTEYVVSDAEERVLARSTATYMVVPVAWWRQIGATIEHLGSRSGYHRRPVSSGSQAPASLSFELSPSSAQVAESAHLSMARCGTTGVCGVRTRCEVTPE